MKRNPTKKAFVCLLLAAVLQAICCRPPDFQKAEFERAAELYGEERYEEALERLMRFLDRGEAETHDDLVRASIKGAEINIMLGDYRSAQELLFDRRYQTGDAELSDEQELLKGRLAAETGEYEESLRILNPLRSRQNVFISRQAEYLSVISLQGLDRWEEALKRIESLLKTAENRDLIYQLHLHAAFSLENLDRTRKALTQLRKAGDYAANDKEEAEIFYHEGRLFRKLGDPRTALNRLEHAMTLMEGYAEDEEAKTDMIMAEMKDIITEELSEREIRGLMKIHSRGYALLPLSMQLAFIYEKRGDMERALKVLDFAEKHTDDPEALRQISEKKQWLEEIGDTLSYRVGIMLPLSGRPAVFGRHVLKGVLLAQEEFQSNYPDCFFELLKGDTSSTDQTVEELFTDMALEGKVISIIGPLLSRNTRKIAEKAGLYKIPVVAVGSSDPDLPSLDPYLFRISSTSKQEIEAISWFAMEKLGVEKFAILRPSHEYGKKLSDWFREEIEKAGRTIVAEREYYPGETDFRGPLESIKDLDFEALFLPDNARTAAMIAPQLQFHDIPAAHVLGISNWNSPDLIDIGGEYAEGFFYADIYYPEDTYPSAAAFLQAYRNTYQDTPNRLTVFGYEAARLLLSAVCLKKIKSRRLMADYLRSQRKFGGVTGPLACKKNGDFWRPIFIMRIHDGKTIPYDVYQKKYQQYP